MAPLGLYFVTNTPVITLDIWFSSGLTISSIDFIKDSV